MLQYKASACSIMFEKKKISLDPPRPSGHSWKIRFMHVWNSGLCLDMSFWAQSKQRINTRQAGLGGREDLTRAFLQLGVLWLSSLTMASIVWKDNLTPWLPFINIPWTGSQHSTCAQHPQVFASCNTRINVMQN